MKEMLHYTASTQPTQPREHAQILDEFAIDVRGLSKRFGKRIIIDNVDIRVKKGSVCGFLGPNGSGKTTTIRMLCGLLSADSGEGQCLGFDFRRDSELIRLNTGYMTQKFGWYDDLTVRQNLEFIARLFGMADIKGAVSEILEQMGLEKRANQLAGALSGGCKQRLALAMCLIHRPKLLLLDEPTAGVDPKARREFWDIIHRLANGGITVLVSTHYMDEAERCVELIYIAYGKILARGSEEEIIASSELDVWELSGKDAAKFANLLKNEPCAKDVSVFGNSYHIVANDADGLQKAVADFNVAGLNLRRIKTSLEDVFIHLLSASSDGRY
ncbi:ABC transporter ATP-binding protein [Campylobacter curvus]|uniref:ABC transporter ATP-binding protein n=1 Tax=Campylobacter curvus TaxID=200 RepID=UPI00146FF0B7|nr:ABC transporter ATP-binding protein [Campylobacter curvus]MBN7288873.1 ABC transporter ATP-binding protein [Campylobacter curvus]